MAARAKRRREREREGKLAILANPKGARKKGEG